MQDAPKPLKRIFSLPKNLPFLKESLLSVGVRSISALAVGKIIALWFGPSGTALFGQLINLYSGFSITGSDGVGRAIVKDGSQQDSEGNEEAVSRTVGTGFGLLALLLCVQWAILLLIFLLTGWTVQGFEGLPTVWIWGLFSLITVGYFVGYLFLIRKQTQWQAYTITSMSLGGLIGLGVGVLLGFTLQNALLALFGFQAAAGLASASLHWNKLNFSISSLTFDRSLVKGILVFAFTIAATGMLARLSDYGLVQWAIGRFGDNHVGIWLAMNKIADSLNIPVLVVINSIVFPIVASKKNEMREIRLFLKPILRQAFLAIAVGMVFLFIFYPLVLQILFSSDFKANTSWKYLQLVGDFFRINSYLVGVLPLALGDTRFYFWLELSSIVTIIALSVYLGGAFGFTGLFLAHAIRYGLYCLSLGIKYRKLVF